MVHSGDATRTGSVEDVSALNEWFGRLPHANKILVAGNHDWCFQRQPQEARRQLTEATYLQDESIEIDGVQFWGSPWQPWFHNWAFNLERGAKIREKWDLIPSSVDVLITHGPPQGILDRAQRGENVGCEELRVATNRIGPRVHIFGHIHEAHGVAEIDETRYVNASICSFRYEPIQEPIVIDL